MTWVFAGGLTNCDEILSLRFEIKQKLKKAKKKEKEEKKKKQEEEQEKKKQDRSQSQDSQVVSSPPSRPPSRPPFSPPFSQQSVNLSLAKLAQVWSYKMRMCFKEYFWCLWWSLPVWLRWLARGVCWRDFVLCTGNVPQ